jgi:5-(hydroxymethyl)furfural/furfural oxidase
MPPYRRGIVGRTELQEFDYVIVGAGAAGSVMASRLSERRETQVLLVEAGEDLIPGREPADIRSVFPLAAFNERYMWPDTRVHWHAGNDSPAVPFPQGRVMGGSSTVMGMWALRGVPDDYDEWARAGAAGWGWDDVLPYFRRLENDQDFGGPLHGNEGPVPIRHEPRDAWSPLAIAVDAEMRRRHWPHIEDLNGDFRDGHCAMANSRYESSRASAGICYLTASVRSRPNLQILTERMATHLLTSGRRITGVAARRPDGSTQYMFGRQTILTMGALRTPAIMLHSGIGPGRELGDLGIKVLADRAGVGENLQNHAVLYVCAMLKPRGREANIPRPAASTYLRWSSHMPACSAADMAIYVRSYLSWHALGRRMASLAPALQKPASRGRVRLKSPNPAETPCVEFKLLSEERDLARLVSATRLAIELFDTPALQEICGAPFVLANASRLMRFNRVSLLNAVRSQFAAVCVDVNARAGTAMLRRLADMRSASGLAANDGELVSFVKQFVTGTGHVSGTCRMGAGDDPLAICDSSGRVYGVEGLRVADASVMPTVPSGNTHIPVIMAAEKIAAGIMAQRIEGALL